MTDPCFKAIVEYRAFVEKARQAGSPGNIVTATKAMAAMADILDRAARELAAIRPIVPSFAMVNDMGDDVAAVRAAVAAVQPLVA